MKQFLSYAVLFILFNVLTAGHPISDGQIEINSGEAEYNGEDLHLRGQVIIQHSLGKIYSHCLSVFSSSENRKKKFSLFHIKDNVHIEFQGGGELLCQEAHIDYSKLIGHFQGNLTDPDVIYKNRSEVDCDISLIIKCLEIEVILTKIQLPQSHSLKTVLKTIEAKNQVRAHYLGDYLLLADQATFECLSTKPTEGTLSLFSKKNHPYCLLTNVKGDRIQADTMKIETLQKHLFLTNPKGIIQLQGKHGTKQTIHFDAGELFWDHLGQSLTLKDNVNIDQDQVFHLNTNHELTIHQNLIDGQKFLRSIISPKNTTMFYEDLQKELIHKIMSPGKLVVDHEHLITTMEGLKDKDGRLILGQQVYFEDSGGDMYADHVQISYEWNNQQLIPTKIILNGNIKLMNRFDGHSQQINSILHYAMADQVEYFPHLQKVILSGQNGHRVLFFDKVNNVQISAPAIKIQKNKEDNKFSVQGIGDVRFTFIETELSQFKERFNLDQNTN